VTIEHGPQIQKFTAEGLDNVVRANEETGELSWQEFCDTAGIENTSSFNPPYLQAETMLTSMLGKPHKEERAKNRIIWKVNANGDGFKIILRWRKQESYKNAWLSVTKPLVNNQSEDDGENNKPIQHRLAGFD